MSDTAPTIEELDPEQAERIARAPMPTKSTLRHRRCIPIQLVKFALLNLRIMSIVAREKMGH